ncbi:MAG: putative metal-dependent hydrolase, partial [Saprospiraceae bacterium]|nr:putative metal-dependent hydrolase [Saprospiraceae bacterium]
HQDKLRYPIGTFEYGKTYSLDDTRKHIKILAKFHKDLKNTLKKLKGGDLEKTYRPGGWTVRQVVHHLADSHLNAYVRFKLAVTENTPIIKPYEEQLWAELEDGKHGSVKTSLKLISALHSRWTDFLKSLQEDDLEKGYYHPASKRTVLLQEAIALYVWHSQHHLGHIQIVVDSKSKGHAGKKTEEEKKSETTQTANAEAAPKKRSISAEHREKIRAAQKARHSKNEAPATEAAPAKRGRKPAEKAAASAPAAPAKRGRKPAEKAAASAPAAPAKRGRKPAEKAAASAPVAPAKRGRKPAEKAAASAPAAPAKRGRKPAVKVAVVATTEAPAKRKRRTKAEMLAAKAAGASVSAPAAPAKRGRKPAEKVATTAPAKVKKAAKTPSTDGAAPKRRGLSPERMAEIRAMRGQNKTAEAPAPKAPKAEKAAKTAKTPKAKAPAADGAAPKKRGLSAERMAEIRAMRGQNKTAEAPAPKAPKAEKAAKTAKTPKAKAPAADGAAPKKRGLSAERMAEIRAMRGQNKTTDAVVSETPASEGTTPKTRGRKKQ